MNRSHLVRFSVFCIWQGRPARWSQRIRSWGPNTWYLLWTTSMSMCSTEEVSLKKCIGTGLELERNCHPMQSPRIRFCTFKNKEAWGRQVISWCPFRGHWGRDAGMLDCVHMSRHCSEWNAARYGCLMETNYLRSLPNFTSSDKRNRLRMLLSRTMTNLFMEFSSIQKSRTLLVVRRLSADLSWISVDVETIGLWWALIGAFLVRFGSPLM